MRTPTDDGADERDRRPERTVHFTAQEFDTLACHAGRLRDELLMQFGGRCGLRGSDIVGWERPDGEAGSGGRPCDRRERDGDGERRSVLDIRGKDTRPDADGPNERTTWVPADTWNAVRRHINRAGLGATAPLIHSQTGGSLGPQSARRVVKDVARPAYEATGRETFRDVLSHDLRRVCASHLLKKEREPVGHDDARRVGAV